MNSYEISNGIYEIDDVWNQSYNDTAPDRKRTKYNKSLLTDDDRSLIGSSRLSYKLKHNFPYHQQKFNACLNICHE